MKIIIVNREPMRVIGLKQKTNTNELIVPDLWEKFFVRMEEIEEYVVPECSLGVCIGDSFEEKKGITHFEYLACQVLKKEPDEIPEGMVIHSIPGGLYAVFTHEGNVETLSETYSYIYDEWLEESVYELDVRDQFEWYDNRFKYMEDDSQLDIHIPIKPLQDFVVPPEEE
jgi:AraC family transcriptional regulator